MVSTSRPQLDPICHSLVVPQSYPSYTPLTKSFAKWLIGLSPYKWNRSSEHEGSTIMDSPGPPEDPRTSPKTPGIDPRRASDRWLSIDGSACKPTTASGGPPGCPPGVIATSSVALLNVCPQKDVTDDSRHKCQGKGSCRKNSISNLLKSSDDLLHGEFQGDGGSPVTPVGRLVDVSCKCHGSTSESGGAIGEPPQMPTPAAGWHHAWT